jgi:hypothetical protein
MLKASSGKAASIASKKETMLAVLAGSYSPERDDLVLTISAMGFIPDVSYTYAA